MYFIDPDGGADHLDPPDTPFGPWRCACTDECKRDELLAPVDIGVQGRGYVIILGGILAALTGSVVGFTLAGLFLRDVVSKW